MQYKVLLVDDDAYLRRLIKRYLEANSFSVIDGSDGAEALVRAKESHPDIVLSDADMPGLDGHSFCHMLRHESKTHSIPVIIMSGKMIDEKEVLSGFEKGADDYLIKPFTLPILLARINAVLRRYDNGVNNENKLTDCGMELDPPGRAVKVNGKPVSLTRKEFDLLTLLTSKAGRVLSVPYLLETVWDYDATDYNSSATVETHISHLRKKLGPSIAKRIVNVTGHGYKFEAGL